MPMSVLAVVSIFWGAALVFDGDTEQKGVCFFFVFFPSPIILWFLLLLHFLLMQIIDGVSRL
jgi:hypothetical protein